MSILRALLLGIILVPFAVPLQAFAAPFERDGGMYWSVRGGLLQVRSRAHFKWLGYDPVYTTVTDPISGATATVLVSRGMQDHSEYRRLEMDYGVVTAASIGYTFLYPENSADFRIEAEAIIRRSAGGETRSDMTATTDRPDSDRLDGTRFFPIPGSVELRSAMVNALMDFHTPTRLTPYLGMGIGYSQLLTSDTLLGVNDEIFGLSWQAIAGIGYNVTPGTMVFVESRYFRLAVDRWSEFFGTNELQNIKFDDWSVGLRLTF